MAVKILYDTDIGSDIDDAVCLAYLLAQPECDLLGVTTVTGDVELRARTGQRALPGGREAGAYLPRRRPAAADSTTPAPCAAGRRALPLGPRPGLPQGAAVDFLRRTIHAHPGEVVLLATGPLTNVALLFALDPEIPALLQGLVLMCGVFAQRWGGHEGHLEWNAQLDPHATAMVYAAPVRRHRSIGLDVTTRVQMGSEEVGKRFQRPC